jgi:hypothetical protein
MSWCLLGLFVALATCKLILCFSHWPMGNGSFKLALNIQSGRQHMPSLVPWSGPKDACPTCDPGIEIASRRRCDSKASARPEPPPSAAGRRGGVSCVVVSSLFCASAGVCVHPCARAPARQLCPLGLCRSACLSAAAPLTPHRSGTETRPHKGSDACAQAAPVPFIFVFVRVRFLSGRVC